MLYIKQMIFCINQVLEVQDQVEQGHFGDGVNMDEAERAILRDMCNVCNKERLKSITTVTFTPHIPCFFGLADAILEILC